MPKHPEIKVVVTDVDGTLLNSKHKLTDKTVEMLKASISQGVKVILATGKTRHSAGEIYKKLGVETEGVFVQGMVINYPGGTEKHLGVMNVELLRRVITFAEDRGFQIIAYSGGRVIARRQTAETILLTESYDEPRPEIVGPLQNVLDSIPINKLMFCGASPIQVGSGGGFDVFIAGRKVGETGQVIGVDMTPEMLSKARRNALTYHERTGLQNVEFRLGEIEHLPVADNSVDVIISNCVINLAPDKRKVFREMFRVSKPGGRFTISDIVADQPVPQYLVHDAEKWGDCLSGALTLTDYMACMTEAGFIGIHLIKSSPWQRIDGIHFFSVTLTGYKLPAHARLQAHATPHCEVPSAVWWMNGAQVTGAESLKHSHRTRSSC